MGKHHVKNGPPPPKNGPPPPPRSDPSNDEYITVLKKVTFDSLVEFSPHELNSCRDGSLPQSTPVYVLLFGRTIKYCVTNIRRKFPTSLSTLSYKTPVFPTDSTLQYHKSNTLALIKSISR